MRRLFTWQPAWNRHSSFQSPPTISTLQIHFELNFQVGHSNFNLKQQKLKGSCENLFLPLRFSALRTKSVSTHYEIRLGFAVVFKVLSKSNLVKTALKLSRDLWVCKIYNIQIKVKCCIAQHLVLKGINQIKTYGYFKYT